MPIYLAHGFRWPRDGFAGIRVHAIVNQLEEVSVEYIQNAHSRDTLLSSLRTLYPNLLKPLEVGHRRLDFLEQYDPDDVSLGAVSQPYAFVCDWVVMIAGGVDGKAEHYSSQLLQSQTHTQSNRSSHASLTAGRPQSPKVRAKTQPMSIAAPFNSPATIAALSVNIDEVKADSPALSTEAWDALAELRDKLADGEKIGWWVIYNGDPDRDYPSSDTETGEDEGEEDETQTETGETGPYAERSQRESTATTSSLTSTDGSSEMAGAHRVRSPTGGRMPPPIPPPPSARPPRSPTQIPSKPTSQTTTKPLPLRPPQSLEEARAQARESPKTPGLRKKIFGSNKK